MANTDLDNDEIDLLELIGTIWRGKWLIMAIMLFAVFVGGYYTFRVAVPLYPATATIVLNAREQQVVTDIESIMTGGSPDSSTINTELEVLRSRELIGQLVDRLDLIENSVFRSDPSEASILDSVLGLVRGREEGDTDGPTEAEIRNAVINAVIRSITVSNVRNTLAINISVTTTDRAMSVLISNTLAEIYIENQIQIKLDAMSDATEFLSRRTAELRQTLEDMEEQLASFTDQAELVSSEVLDAQSLQLRELRTRLADTRNQLVEETVRLESLQALWEEGELDELIATANEFRLNRARSQYREGQLSLEDLRADVEQYLEQMVAQADRDAEQVTALEASEASLAALLERQSQELIALRQLERETETTRLLYESFFTRLQETNVQQGLETADARILSEAIPQVASSPRKSMILALSAILGIMFGIGLVLLREMRFAGFRTADELQTQSARRVLASVTLIPTKDRGAILKFLNNKPNSVFSEAVRNLRTSILMSNIDHPPQVIMLTSSVPGEGKTTLALALARNMVGMGKRVLLIEADIRRRVFGAYFDTTSSVALLDLLTGKLKPEEVNPFVEELGFSVLTGTRSDVNAADLFASERFAELLTELRKHHDYILIDTPPVLAVPDARVIGAKSDANVYVVRWNKTTRTQLRHGLEMLDGVDVQVSGLVLNQVDSRKMKTYGYGGQYGYDSYSSSYYDQ